MTSQLKSITISSLKCVCINFAVIKIEKFGVLLKVLSLRYANHHSKIARCV